MQIVIDIPEEEYMLIKQKMKLNVGGVTSEAEQIIANGTPLPKGHGRLIDADAYAKRFDTTINGRIGEEYVIAPTIIEADKESEK